MTGIAEHSDSLQYDTREFAFRKRRCRNKSESSDLALSCDTALPLERSRVETGFRITDRVCVRLAWYAVGERQKCHLLVLPSHMVDYVVGRREWRMGQPARGRYRSAHSIPSSRFETCMNRPLRGRLDPVTCQCLSTLVGSEFSSPLLMSKSHKGKASIERPGSLEAS